METQYLFCFLKPDKKKKALNQRRHIAVCRKLGCGYLDESSPEIKCTCEPTPEYFVGFTKKVKKAKKAERKADEEDEEESDEV